MPAEEQKTSLLKLPVACHRQTHYYHITAPHPEGLGQKMLCMLPWRDAGDESWRHRDYINVPHGTSTPLLQRRPKLSRSVLRIRRKDLNISQLQINDRPLPWCSRRCRSTCRHPCCYKRYCSSYNQSSHRINPIPDPQTQLLLFNNAQEREVNAALSNTFGFGGHNASVIVKKYKP